MAKHDVVTWKFPRGYEAPIGSANIEIEVRQGAAPVRARTLRAKKRSSELLGHLLVSKGGIEWRPRAGKRVVEMRWEAFAALMDEQR